MRILAMQSLPGSASWRIVCGVTQVAGFPSAEFALFVESRREAGTGAMLTNDESPEVDRLIGEITACAARSPSSSQRVEPAR